MNFGSVFTGIGGFDLGFERAGMTCAWQVEIDSDCNRVLQRQFPNTERHTDVTTIGRLAAIDVLCGGFPCQDLSVAGKRAGLAGERSGLWFEFLRIIGLNRPRWIVIENVPGLLSSDEGRDFAVILRGLVECGYCLAWRIVDAQFYGVAQRRRRVFIVGSLGDGSSAEILFESESVSWNPPTRGEAGSRVASAITTGTGKSSGPRNGNGEPLHLITGSLAAHSKEHGHAMTTQQAAESGHLVYPIQEVGARESKNQNGIGIGVGADGDVMYTLQSGQVHGVAMPLKAKANSSHDDSHESYVVAPLTSAYAKSASDDNDGLNGHLIAFSSKDHGADAGEIAPTLRSQNFKDSHMNGGGQVAIAFTKRGDGVTGEDIAPSYDTGGGGGMGSGMAIAFTERTRAEGRTFESQEELAYAITNPGSGGRTHSRQVAGQFGVRRLTPRECERLQSFPDDFTRWDANGKEISDSARYRMLGNAVCVNVAAWIGKRIMEIANK